MGPNCSAESGRGLRHSLGVGHVDRYHRRQPSHVVHLGRQRLETLTPARQQCHVGAGGGEGKGD